MFFGMVGLSGGAVQSILTMRGGGVHRSSAAGMRGLEFVQLGETRRTEVRVEKVRIAADRNGIANEPKRVGAQAKKQLHGNSQPHDGASNRRRRIRGSHPPSTADASHEFR
jgi:hypothetical protein